MEEGDCGGKCVVVINDIGQVGHGLVAFIERGRKDFVTGSHVLGRVDYVKGPLPAIAEDTLVLMRFARNIEKERGGTHSGSSS